MGKRGQEGSEEDKKPPKPKKVFTLSYEFWDDGEVRYSRVEKIPQDRGAPKNLPYLEGDEMDFRRSIKTRLQKDTVDILNELYKGLAIEESFVRKLYSDDTSLNVEDDKNEGEEE